MVGADRYRDVRASEMADTHLSPMHANDSGGGSSGEMLRATLTVEGCQGDQEGEVWHETGCGDGCHEEAGGIYERRRQTWLI